MSRLELKGKTLGQKYEYYNALVESTSDNQTVILESINNDILDIDNLFKIDVACARRDVQYVLEGLMSGDMLYVSRVLRRSPWLFEEKYAHIVNPHYLHQELFPEMSNKAKNKLLLCIRLNLRNAMRVDEFYEFCKEDFKVAQKWLPHCSETLIINVVRKDWSNITVKIMQRLCRKSLLILKTCCEINPSICWLQSSKSFLFTDTEGYLTIVNSVEEVFIPKFGKKATKFLMDNYPRIIYDNFHKYCYKIDLSEFGKRLKVDEIQVFLTKQLQSERDEIRSWCKYKNMKHFMRQVPIEKRYQLVQELFLNRIDSKYLTSKTSKGSEIRKDLYSWYRFASFEIAFDKLRHKIFDETHILGQCDDDVINLLELEYPFTALKTVIQPWALEVLVICAGNNMHNLQTLMGNYCGETVDKGVYDEYVSSTLLRLTKTHKYDEITWEMLNEIFHNMGIYSDNREVVGSDDINIRYIPAIVLYNVIHDQSIPRVIEKHISLHNFKNVRNKLEPDERNKVFKYLYKFALDKLTSTRVLNKRDFSVVVSMCDEIIWFMKDWNKSIVEFPFVLDKIRDLITYKNENLLDANECITLIDLFRQHKCIRRPLFEDMLALYPSDETCLNVLKHDPELLVRHKKAVEAIILKNGLSLRRTFRKLRMFWPNSEAKQWIHFFFTSLQQTTAHKYCIEGLFILLPHKDALKIVNTYTPDNNFINSKEEKSINSINVRKNIAKFLYLIRPSVSFDIMLLYTKGDYYRFTAPLLHYTLLNIRYDQEVIPYINKILSDSSSIQKLGISYILKNVDINEAKRHVRNAWNETTSYSVRCGLFKYTYKFLIKEKETRMIMKIWELLDEIMCNLSKEFYESVMIKMRNVSRIPKIVKHKFMWKSILYLKIHFTVNDSNDIDDFVGNFWRYLRYNVNVIEDSFLMEVLLEAVEKSFIKDCNNGNCDYICMDILRLITTYLTTNNSIEGQKIKFDKIFIPTMDWFNIERQGHRKMFKSFLESLSLNISKRLFNANNHVVPVYLYKNIQTILNDTFALEKEYNIITFWNISVLFVELLANFSNTDVFKGMADKFRSDNSYYFYQYEYPELQDVYSHIAPAFGKACLNYFKQDVISTHPTIWPLASKSMMDAFISLSFPYSAIYKTLKYMLLDEDATAITTCYQIANGVIRCTYINSGNGEYMYSVDEGLEKVILSHPSKGIRTYYRHCDFPFYSNYYCENENSNWRRSGLMKQYGPNDSDLY